MGYTWAQGMPEVYLGEKACCQHGDVQGGDVHASHAQHPFVSTLGVQAVSCGSAGASRWAGVEGTFANALLCHKRGSQLATAPAGNKNGCSWQMLNLGMWEVVMWKQLVPQ